MNFRRIQTWLNVLKDQQSRELRRIRTKCPAVYLYYYTLNSLTLFWLAESVQWIFKISARNFIPADYTIIMSRSRVIMSRSRVIMSYMTRVHDFQGWSCQLRATRVACRHWRGRNMTSKFFVQCIIKKILDSVLVISRIIKVSVRVISLSLRLRLITLTSTLIILDITKTSSNNCLQYTHNTAMTKWGTKSW